MMKSLALTQRQPKSILFFVLGLFLFGICVKLSWLRRHVDFLANQAAFDAYHYHVPQINEFITNGYSAQYHNYVAMTPGLHILYAYIARGLGLGEFEYQSAILFSIHSVWMVLYLALNLAIIHFVMKRNDEAIIITLPLLASSYPAFSWIWPTTDLPATVLCLVAIAMEFQTWRSNAARLAIYALLGAGGVLIRQHYAFLAGIPAGLIIIDAFLRRDWHIDLRRLAISLTPLIPSLVILAYFVAIWGGPVPADQAYHFAPLAAPISLAHLLGFTGLIGAPFAWSLVRLARQEGICLTCVVVLAAVVAGASVALLPLEPNVLAGRFGSMLWTIEGRLPSQGLRLGYLFAAIWLGSAVWMAVAALCWRQKWATPTVVIFLLYAITLLVQEFCFQRYVEEPILLTLAVFILLQGRLPRVEQGIWVAAFGLFGIISWSKLLFNVGGFGMQ